MHVFEDASKKAYGGVACLQVEYTAVARSLTVIIMDKSKTTSIQSQTTPRLELLAACLVARLSSFLWSASEILLHWLCSKKAPDSFVTWWIEEIKGLTNQILPFSI